MRNNKRNLKKVSSVEGLRKELKTLNVNSVKKPYSIILNGKPLSRNVIYIGEELPDFLLQNYKREIYTLSRRDGSVVDAFIRQKVKKTIIKALISSGYKYEARTHLVKDTTSTIKNVSVRIKHFPRKGWAIIIGKRKSTDIDQDTVKVRAYLEKKGVEIKDDAICPTYCVPKKESIIEE